MQDSFQKIYSFSEIMECAYPWLDKHTLFLFDVDSVILVPQEPCLHPKNYALYQEKIESITHQLSRPQRHFLNHAIIGHSPQLVETEAFFEFFELIQEHKCLSMAFTAAKKGVFSAKSTHFHEIRSKQLRQFNIDFSSISPLGDVDFNDLNPTYGDYPSVRSGIIYSCGLDNPKGNVFKKIFQQLRLKRVVFFDDKLKNLESMQNVLSGHPECEFHGFHYLGVENMPTPPVDASYIESYYNTLAAAVQEITWI